jgi:hypothetical protein
VVVVISQTHYYLMLQRNPVCTALTRARQRAVLIVSRWGGAQTICTRRQGGAVCGGGNNLIAQRHSGLAEHLPS